MTAVPEAKLQMASFRNALAQAGYSRIGSGECQYDGETIRHFTGSFKTRVRCLMAVKDVDTVVGFSYIKNSERCKVYTARDSVTDSMFNGKEWTEGAGVKDGCTFRERANW